MKQKNGGRGFENISIIFYCKFLFCGCFGQLRFYLILKDFSAYVCFYTSICLCRKCAPITNIKCSSLSCVVFPYWEQGCPVLIQFLDYFSVIIVLFILAARCLKSNQVVGLKQIFLALDPQLFISIVFCIKSLLCFVQAIKMCLGFLFVSYFSKKLSFRVYFPVGECREFYLKCFPLKMCGKEK